MKTSVIIPTYNAHKYLPKLLERLDEQSKSFELIIIDSSSQDDTVAIAKTHTSNVIVIPKEEFDHGGTRTLAARYATGDILIFLTQDALPADGHTLEKILSVFEDKQVAAAYGRQLSYEDTNLFGKHLRAFNYPEHSYTRSLEDKQKYGIKTAFLSDSFAAYRRSSLEAIGWFKNGLILGEDSYAGAKLLLAGFRLAYVSEAKVYHSHSYTIKEEFMRYFDIGVFHASEAWILENFGKAEGEGMKYIRSEWNYLVRHGGFWLFFEFFFRNLAKYGGYKLGQHYTKLPFGLRRLLSMHSGWWKA